MMTERNALKHQCWQMSPVLVDYLEHVLHQDSWIEQLRAIRQLPVTDLYDGYK